MAASRAERQWLAVGGMYRLQGSDKQARKAARSTRSGGRTEELSPEAACTFFAGGFLTSASCLAAAGLIK